MNATEKAQVVATCTHEWYEIVDRDGELVLSEDTFPDGWEEAAEAADLDAEDEESWIVKVLEVAERHSALRAGDYACCQGCGSDVVFVRFGTEVRSEN